MGVTNLFQICGPKAELLVDRWIRGCGPLADRLLAVRLDEEHIVHLALPRRVGEVGAAELDVLLVRQPKLVHGLDAFAPHLDGDVVWVSTNILNTDLARRLELDEPGVLGDVGRRRVGGLRATFADKVVR